MGAVLPPSLFERDMAEHELPQHPPLAALVALPRLAAHAEPNELRERRTLLASRRFYASQPSGEHATVCLLSGCVVGAATTLARRTRRWPS
jgi:hypothetical protein